MESIKIIFLNLSIGNRGNERSQKYKQMLTVQ